VSNYIKLEALSMYLTCPSYLNQHDVHLHPSSSMGIAHQSFLVFINISFLSTRTLITYD
jgi:hypothetical protein